MTANVRIFFWALLGVAALLNVEMWYRDYPNRPAAVVSAPSAPLDDSVPSAAPAAAAPATAAATGGAPAATTAPAVVAAPVAAPAASGAPAATSTEASAATAGSVHVVTDVLDIDVSLAGGELKRADLPKYPVVKNETTPVRLLNRDPSDANADPLYVVQTGLAPAAGGVAPTHQTLFTSAVSEVKLADGQDEVRLPLTWTNGAGVTVTKTLVFRRGQYRIGLDYSINNASTEPFVFASYAQILRDNTPIQSSMFKAGSSAYKGPAIYDGTKYEKLKITGSSPATLDQSVTNGWLAALQHHFVAAIVPPAGTAYHYALKTQGNQYLLSATGPQQSVAPGTTATLSEVLFVGPKLQAQLKQAGPRLELVTDYGKLTFLAQPLFWVLDKVHALFGNWGFTIIVTTFLLKLLFYPLSEASGKSMAKMKAVQPRIKTLQETYKDDRQKLGQEMMQLYQREKINPLAGCLPLLIQMPVFLAFYWVLMESVEMRQAPFMGWIHDLSSRDPYFILPAIMAAAMFVQYKLNPQMGTDPVQQKVFMIMPLAMSVTFAFFPSGLVLYWVTNTLLSILQQWNINRRIAAATARARR
ncbi:MAG: membrane protein insertase YidC [Steroidobacteraceae bacterium]